MTVPPPWSVGTPRIQREVHTGCGHLHRHVLVRKCSCCAEDTRQQKGTS